MRNDMKKLLICLVLCLSFIITPLCLSGCTEKPIQNGEIVLPDDKNNQDNDNEQDDTPELVDKGLKEECNKIITILLESDFFDTEQDFSISREGDGGKITCNSKTFSLEEFGILNAYFQPKFQEFTDYSIKTFIEQNKFIIIVSYK